MGAAVDHDLQKSFARATGGPASMRGGKVGEDTIVTEVYRAAETKREEERVEAAKRTKKSGKSDSKKSGKKSDKKTDNPKRKKSASRPGANKRRRQQRQSEVITFKIRLLDSCRWSFRSCARSPVHCSLSLQDQSDYKPDSRGSNDYETLFNRLVDL